MIRTERLVLRRARIEDLPAFHAVLSDPRATLYWSTTAHESLEQTRAWVESMIASPPHESEDFVVEYEGRVVGKAGFYRLPEIGYILHPDVWGKGLAFEACSAAIAHVWSAHPGIGALTADVDPRNAASIGLLERLGFQRTGFAERTFFVGGVWCDSFFYRLDRP